jgi:hypothetical protein
MGGGEKQDGDRVELGEGPPFLSWRAIYLIVLGALAIEIVLGVVLTAVAR